MILVRENRSFMVGTTMRFLSVCWLLFVGFLSLPAWADQDSERVINMTIEDVNKAPLEFHQKRIRVRGVVDECISLTCHICAAANLDRPKIKDADCLTASFAESGGTSDRKSDDESSGSMRQYLAIQSLETLYRFSEITAEGVYDASCAGNLIRKSAGSERRIVICTDRATTFRIEAITSVHKRWPATEGLFSMYEGEPLNVLTAEESRELLAAYDEVLRDWEDKLDTPDRYRAYRQQVYSGALGPEQAVLCHCLTDNCAGLWPSKQGHFLETPNNPYKCVGATRTSTGWRFMPQW